MAIVNSTYADRGQTVASKRWRLAYQIGAVVLGSVIAALGYSLFQLPFQLAGGGLGGLAIILAAFSQVPAGLLYLILNIPVLVLGFYTLGRWPFVLSTLLGVAVFSVAADLFTLVLPMFLQPYPVTSNMFLSAVYGGLVSGIGTGIVYRAGGSLGSTGIIARVIQQRTGFPLSQSYVYADGAIIFLSGLVFGWEIALHAFLMMLLNGMASDFALEGPSTVRTAMVVTRQPQLLTNVIVSELQQGASAWPVYDGRTDQLYSLVLCTVYRPQVRELKRVVAAVDPEAFVVIGNAHQALGTGFRPLVE